MEAEVEALQETIDALYAAYNEQQYQNYELQHELAVQQAINAELEYQVVTLTDELNIAQAEATFHEAILNDVETAYIELENDLAISEAQRAADQEANAELINLIQADYEAQIEELLEWQNDAQWALDAHQAIRDEQEVQIADLTAQFNELDQLLHAQAQDLYDILSDAFGGPIPPPGPALAIEYTTNWIANMIDLIVENHNETLGEHQRDLIVAQNQVAAANSAAQEASARANSNAANVAAWYEEAQRLQAEVDRLQEELDNQ